jgi:glycosyltransferase involved in cell wall biosynthesis
MLKIVFIYRKPRPSAFSIENVFHTVSRQLRSLNYNVVDYVLRGKSFLWSDIRALRHFNADVYHVTGDVNYVLLFLPWRKTIITVHDIGHYLFGLTGPRKTIYKWLWLILPMNFARRITAVSVATHSNIVEHLRISPKQVNVIENCYNSLCLPSSSDFNRSMPRILQVGTKPYKNVPRLIHALYKIPCILVLIGELSPDIVELLSNAGVYYENYVSIDQAELLDQYERADIVSFVSIGEGFGMPIIEAQAMARALITSNIPPMSLVAGPGACLVDPLDTSTIRTGIQRLIEDDTYRRQVITDGLKNVEAYSPEHIAFAYIQLYHGMLAP